MFKKPKRPLGLGESLGLGLGGDDQKVNANAQKVSVVIPALNEEKSIASTIAALKACSPPVHEILVVVAQGNSDKTAQIARKAGAHRVITRSPRGRSSQQNLGANAAKGDIVCFVHADTRVPPQLVQETRRQLAKPDVALGAFRPVIVDDTRQTNNDKVMKFSSWHNANKTWIYPFLLKPYDACRGLRVVFGDQSIFVRREDFKQVGGYDEKLAIMEDADLCLRMHKSGAKTGRRRRIVQSQLPARTSGRRIVELGGEIKATYAHACIGFGWALGLSPARIRRMYESIYMGDDPR